MPSSRIVINGPVFLVNGKRGAADLHSAINQFLRTHRVALRRTPNDPEVNSEDEDEESEYEQEDSEEEEEDTASLDGSVDDEMHNRDSTPPRVNDRSRPDRENTPVRLYPLYVLNL